MQHKIYTIFTILNVWYSYVNYIHIIVQQNRSLEGFHLAKLKVCSHFTTFSLLPPHTLATTLLLSKS